MAALLLVVAGIVVWRSNIHESGKVEPAPTKAPLAALQPPPTPLIGEALLSGTPSIEGKREPQSEVPKPSVALGAFSPAVSVLDTSLSPLPAVAAPVASQPRSEAIGTAQMYAAHAPLRVPSLADPDSPENRFILYQMVTKALRRPSDVKNSQVQP